MLRTTKALTPAMVPTSGTALSFLSPAGMSLVRVCAPPSLSTSYSGRWQTASTLFPSGSRTKAP
jgi:hypothetical protein